MASIDKKQNLKAIIWLIIIILLGFFMLWGLYHELKTDREFQKHKEQEENQSF
jgi:hypothetical protein